MAQTYQKIGDYISVLDNRNTDGSITNLMGISIEKCYIPSVANVIGTDLRNYKVIRKGQFACSLMQVSRDQRIPLAMYASAKPAIMSPAYVMFEVNRPDELLSEYMELWFKRAEFDREASFYAVGGVRGSLDWEDFCKMKLPVPPISEQRKIVHDYQVITNRIALLRKMNTNLERQAFVLFDEFVKNSNDKKRLCDFGKVLTGKTPSTDVSEYFGDDVPFIKTPDMHGNLYIVSWESSLSRLGADSQLNKYLPEEAVIVSCIGANAGEVSLTSCIAQTNQQINAVITKYPKFLYCALKRSREELRALGDAGSTMININKSLFENYQVVTLEPTVLKDLEEALSPFFIAVKNNLREMVILDNLKSCMMNRFSLST